MHKPHNAESFKAEIQTRVCPCSEILPACVIIPGNMQILKRYTTYLIDTETKASSTRVYTSQPIIQYMEPRCSEVSALTKELTLKYLTEHEKPALNKSMYATKF